MSQNITQKNLDDLEETATKMLNVEELSEVVSRIPVFLQRWLVYFVCGVILSCFTLLYFGQIYVVAEGVGKIVCQQGNLSIQTKSEGIIKDIYVVEGQFLEKNKVIATIDLEKVRIDLQALQRQLYLQQRELKNYKSETKIIKSLLKNPGIFFKKNYNSSRGNLTKFISDIKLKKVDLKHKQKRQRYFLEKKKPRIQKQLKIMNERIVLLKENIQETSKDLRRKKGLLKRKSIQLKRNYSLASSGVISKEELEEKQYEYEREELNIAEERRILREKSVEITNTKMKILDLEIQMETEQNNLQQQYQYAQDFYLQSLDNILEQLKKNTEKINSLQTDIKNAQGKIVIKKKQLAFTNIIMPTNGTIVQLNIKPNQVITKGFSIASVTPDGAKLIVKVSVPNEDIGFVEKRMISKIKVDAYPFVQFGTLPGRVVEILPNMEKQDEFIVHIDIEKDEFITQINRHKIFPELTVKADILTRKETVMRLLVNQIKLFFLENEENK
ncbi:HlyD family efflux transporter periplasmic adaptor subunit [Candidatus Uabimicrobium sp. HlEnr_7]|uniref:HlyD family efflux transporter periplasmic adaptor subunit n=1 Tax=Candidatus Uabimicrobium helgolandensis TaxID=3095367 RepID=UPI0035577081